MRKTVKIFLLMIVATVFLLSYSQNLGAKHLQIIIADTQIGLMDFSQLKSLVSTSERVASAAPLPLPPKRKELAKDLPAKERNPATSQSSEPTSCSISMAIEDGDKTHFRRIPLVNGIAQISLEHKAYTTIKIESTMAHSVKYRCRKDTNWTPFETSNGTQAMGGFNNDITCEARAFKDESDDVGTPCTPAKFIVKDNSFSCPVTGTVSSLTMLATIETTNHTRQGYYFIYVQSTYSNKVYFYFDQKWTEFNQDELSTIKGYAMPYNPYPFNIQVFENSDLNSYRKHQVFIGYGLGTSLSEAYDDMKSSYRYKSCGTIE